MYIHAVTLHETKTKTIWKKLFQSSCLMEISGKLSISSRVPRFVRYML